MNTLVEYWSRRSLLKYLVITKLKVSKKDLLLGYAWWILDPLLLMFIYWLLVGVILERGGPQYPLFVLCGLVPFRAIATSMGQSVSSISSKFSIISQINFPRIFLPLSDVLSNFIKLAFAFIVVAVFAAFYGKYPGFLMLALVVPFVIQVLITTGMALILSILGVFVRDFRNLVQFIVRIWLYGSPVLYSIERIPPDWQDLFLLNPMVSILMMYRDIFIHQQFPSTNHILIGLAEAMLIMAIGLIIFHRNESRILKAL